jgi:hypothetical protein
MTDSIYSPPPGASGGEPIETLGDIGDVDEYSVQWPLVATDDVELIEGAYIKPRYLIVDPSAPENPPSENEPGSYWLHIDEENNKTIYRVETRDQGETFLWYELENVILSTEEQLFPDSTVGEDGDFFLTALNEGNEFAPTQYYLAGPRYVGPPRGGMLTYYWFENPFDGQSRWATSSPEDFVPFDIRNDRYKRTYKGGGEIIQMPLSFEEDPVRTFNLGTASVFTVDEQETTRTYVFEGLEPDEFAPAKAREFTFVIRNIVGAQITITWPENITWSTKHNDSPQVGETSDDFIVAKVLTLDDGVSYIGWIVAEYAE